MANENGEGGKEGSFKQIDRKSPEIMAALKDAPLFKKQGQVKARPAKIGEKINTNLKSGAKETENVGGVGDWVVTNPSGEQYIIHDSTFYARYEATDEEGVYQARGYCKAIENPFREPIEIMASWGSPQTGDARCYIADVSDKKGNLDGEPYLIDGDAFAETYKRVK